MSNDNEIQEQSQDRDTMIRDVTINYRAAYRTDTPKDLLDDARAAVAVYELVRAPVEIVSVEVSSEQATVDDDFGKEHYQAQTEVQEKILSMVFSDSPVLPFPIGEDESAEDVTDALMNVLKDVLSDVE